MQYEVVMTNGDRAECGSVSAVLTCAETLWRDSEGESKVEVVNDCVAGIWQRSLTLTAVAQQHLLEVAAGGDPYEGEET